MCVCVCMCGCVCVCVWGRFNEIVYPHVYCSSICVLYITSTLAPGLIFEEYLREKGELDSPLFFIAGSLTPPFSSYSRELDSPLFFIAGSLTLRCHG